MKKFDPEKAFEENLKCQQKLIEEIKEIKKKIDIAEAKLNAKRAKLISEGNLPSGGYIMTEEDTLEDLQSMNESFEYFEDLYLKVEKDELAELKGDYVEKLLEYDSLTKDLIVTQSLIDEQKQNEPGGENE